VSAAELTLEEIRAQIDLLDDEIVELLVRRAELVMQAAGVKADIEQVRDPARIAAVIQHARDRAEELNGDGALIAAIYQRMVEVYVNAELIEKRGSG
jgi:chorismate mutase